MCLWLVSYNDECVHAMDTDGLLEKMTEVVRSVQKEKVLRVFIATLRVRWMIVFLVSCYLRLVIGRAELVMDCGCSGGEDSRFAWSGWGGYRHCRQQNVVSAGNLNEDLIEIGFLKTAQLLSSKKWSDEDIAEDLKFIVETLESNVTELRYRIHVTH